MNPINAMRLSQQRDRVATHKRILAESIAREDDLGREPATPEAEARYEVARATTDTVAGMLARAEAKLRAMAEAIDADPDTVA